MSLRGGPKPHPATCPWLPVFPRAARGHPALRPRAHAEPSLSAGAALPAAGLWLTSAAPGGVILLPASPTEPLHTRAALIFKVGKNHKPLPVGD